MSVIVSAGETPVHGDRRRDIRCSASDAALSVSVDGRRAELINMSRGGLLLRMEGPGGGLCSRLLVELSQNDVSIARVALEVTRKMADGNAAVLGGRIVDTEIVASGRPPLPRSGDIVEIRDPGLRAQILERLRSRSNPAIAQFESGRSIETRLGPASVDPKSLAIRSTGHGTHPHGQFVSVEVSHLESRFVLEAKVVRDADGECVLSEPHRVLSLCRRQCERVAVARGAGFLRFADVLEPERTVDAPIVDLSPDGLAIELPEGCILPPAPVPATIRIGERRFRVLAEAHRLSQRSSGSRVVGLRIKTLREKDLLRLARVCESLRFPNLIQRRDVAPEAVAELMRQSGYLGLRDGTGPSSEWHSSPGDESLAVDTVFRADNGAVLGHFSCARIYPQTWILHQLATVGLRRARIAYPLYIQLMHWIGTLATDEGYCLAYFNQDRSWHQTIFRDFVQWVGSEELALIAPLDRFEPCPPATTPRPVLEGVMLRDARPEERSFAVGLARSKLPRLLCDALHLHEHAIATPNLCEAHRALGLERMRRTLVVEVRGEILGVAICETGSRDLSLFNLLNLAYLFFREPVAPSLARAAQLALFNGVSEFYAQRGSAQPLIVAPAGNAQFASGAGFQRAETMGAWTASLDGIRQWRNYVHFCLGELADRKRGRSRDAA
jgi:hypothetical protein